MDSMSPPRVVKMLRALLLVIVIVCFAIGRHTDAAATTPGTLQYVSSSFNLTSVWIYRGQSLGVSYSIQRQIGNSTSQSSASSVSGRPSYFLAQIPDATPVVFDTTICNVFSDPIASVSLNLDDSTFSVQGSTFVPVGVANAAITQLVLVVALNINATAPASAIQTATCSSTPSLRYAILSRAASSITIYSPSAPLAGSSGAAIFRSSAALSPVEVASNTKLNAAFVSPWPFASVVTSPCSPPPFVRASTAITIEGWFRTVPVADQSSKGKGCCWDVMSSDDFEIGLFDSGKPQFNLKNSVPCSQLRLPDEADYRDNQWHLISGVYVNGTKYLYMDGRLLGTQQCEPSLQFVSRRIDLGRDALDPFEGWLDSIRVWNAGRTADQIRDTMNRQLYPEEIAQTMAYYDFDDIDDANLVLKDKSPSGFHIAMGTAPTVTPTFVNNRRLAPRWQTSNAPIYGSTMKIHIPFSTTAGVTSSGPKVDAFLPAYSPLTKLSIAAIAGSTITITSLPQYMALKSKTDGSVLKVGSVLQVPVKNISQPHVWSNNDPLITMEVLLTDPTVSAMALDAVLSDPFSYTATMNGETSPPATVEVTIARVAPPVAGSPGNMLFCDGINDYAFSDRFSLVPKTFSSTNLTGLGSLTIEFWALFQVSLKVGTVFSIGDTEVEGNWCAQLDTSKGPNGQWNLKSEQDSHCVGRLLMHVPETTDGGGSAYGGWDVSTNNGKADYNVATRYHSWSFFSVTIPLAEGTGPDSLLQVYVDGQLFSSKQNYNIKQKLNGLSLCHWDFYGDWHWFEGYVDDFRVWDHIRTPDQIRANMHTQLSGNETGLLAYYTFNEDTLINITPTTIAGTGTSAAVSVPPNPTAPSMIQDLSGKNNTLTLGGCVPNLPPYCEGGAGMCVFDKQPQVPCYLSDSQSFLTDSMPLIVPSYAPIGGHEPDYVAAYGKAVVVNLNSAVASSTQFAAARLNAFQYPPAAAQFSFENIPDASYGVLSAPTAAASNSTVVSSVSLSPITTASLYTQNLAQFTPAAHRGGTPFVTLSYRVFNGIALSNNVAKITLHVPCGAGEYLDNAAKNCILCPPGSYQKFSSFNASCDLAPLGYVVRQAGQSDFVQCEEGTFSDIAGLSDCKQCSDFGFPSPCLPTSNLTKATQKGLYAFVAIAAFVVVASIILVLAWRSHRVIFSATPLFLLYALLGAGGLLVAGALFIPDQTAALCTAKVWMLSLSFQIFFSGLMLKSYRLHKIFNSTVLITTNLSNAKLFSIAPIFILFDLILLIIWTSVFPFSVTSELQRTCQSDGGTIFIAILLSSKGILLAYTGYLCYQIWAVPARYNESKSLALVLYNGIGVSVMLLVLWFGLGSNVPAQSIVMVIGVVYFVFSSTLLMFAPKALAILSESGNKSWIKFRMKGGKLKVEDKPMQNGSVLDNGSVISSSHPASKGSISNHSESGLSATNVTPTFLMQLMSESRAAFNRLKQLTTEHEAQEKLQRQLNGRIEEQREKWRKVEWEVEFLKSKHPNLRNVVAPPEEEVSSPTATSQLKARTNGSSIAASTTPSSQPKKLVGGRTGSLGGNTSVGTYQRSPSTVNHTISPEMRNRSPSGGVIASKDVHISVAAEASTSTVEGIPAASSDVVGLTALEGSSSSPPASPEPVVQRLRLHISPTASSRLAALALELNDIPLPGGSASTPAPTDGSPSAASPQ